MYMKEAEYPRCFPVFPYPNKNDANQNSKRKHDPLYKNPQKKIQNLREPFRPSHYTFPRPHHMYASSTCTPLRHISTSTRQHLRAPVIDVRRCPRVTSGQLYSSPTRSRYSSCCSPSWR